jgi:Gpi18-like mannosyltransferase
MQRDLIKNSSNIFKSYLFLFLFLLAFILRISLYKIQSSDYIDYLHPWYEFIRTHNGFAALKYNFSDYNVVYLYLLTLATYIPIQPIVAIKTLSVVFDAALALFTYLILRLKYKHSSVPVIGAIAVLFAPTLFLNSAAWGQCDAIYTACCLGSLYFFLSKRYAWACLFFGLAISFKLQAIFFLPVLVVLFFTGKLSIKSLILIPMIFLTLLVPAFLAGRDIWSLLTIYAGQANENAFLTDAPNLYQWLPGGAFEDWKWRGINLTIIMVSSIILLTMMSKKRIASDIILKLVLIFALTIPFFLPDMHQRYFYLADVFSIIYAFSLPRYWFVAVIEQICSLLGYALFFKIQVVSLSSVSYAIFLLIVLTVADLVKTLYPTIHRTSRDASCIRS